ncbi:MAG: diguanylate cyclase [Phycisphaerales bacterium]|nr:MAG: diguanylate cyclase [Phycisphaerales bacterium]
MQVSGTDRPETENVLAWRDRFGQATVSLQTKATILVVGLTLSVATGVSGYFLQASARLARTEQQEKMVQLASMLAKASAMPLADGDTSRLKSLAEEVIRDGPLDYVIFADADGSELIAVGSRPSGVQGLCDPAAKPAIQGTPVYHSSEESRFLCMDISYPVDLRDTPSNSADQPQRALVGYLQAGMPADAWHRSMSSTLDLVVGIGVIVIVVAIPLGFVLIRRILSPVQGVTEAMQKFSEGDWNVRSSTCRRDEIGRLAAAFNRMADQHQQAHDRVLRLNVELEKRVTERTRQLRELALREPLTGLYNRRHFSDMIDHSFAEAQRYDSELACIMLDLDDFKKVNDEYGHQTGDELLVLTATTIASQLRSADVAARFGGDEFIVLLPQTGTERASIVGRRIIEKFGDEVSERFPQLAVGMSMGIASRHSPGVDDTDSLIRAADRAMYEAKGAGTNLVYTLTTDSIPVPSAGSNLAG